MNITIFKRWNNYRIEKRKFRHASKIGEALVGVPLMDKPNTRLDNFKIDYSRYDEDIANFIRNFEKNLKENFKGVDLSLFYANISNLKIGKLEGDDKFNKINKIGCTDKPISIERLGQYKSRTNELFYLDKYDEEILARHFFQMSSSWQSTNKCYSGYAQGIPIEGEETKFKKIGTGLMEIYTQILAERYYGNNLNNISFSNEFFILNLPYFTKFFVNRLEDIVGQELMEKLYLEADLKELVKKLEEYNTKENIMCFLYHLDTIISLYIGSDNLSLEEIKNAEYYSKLTFKYIRDFLFTTIINKINIEKKNNNNINDLKNMLIDFINKFRLSYKNDDKQYSLLPITDVIKYSSKVRKIK